MLSVADLLRDSAFVDGHWVDSQSGSRYGIFNPADGIWIADVPDMSAADVELAIRAASRAFDEWKNRTAGERASLLKRWNRLILKNADDLALLMTLEQGKPLREARDEVKYVA